MDAKEQRAEAAANANAATTNINIDINGENDNTIGPVKSMSSSDENSRIGLSKEELMKYANQPFWVRLRNVLFASFWILWISILLVAIGYVVKSDGCHAGGSAAGAGGASSPATPSSS